MTCLIIRKNDSSLFGNAVDNTLSDYLIMPFLIANRAEVKIMCLTGYDEGKYADFIRADSEAVDEPKRMIRTNVGLLKYGLLDGDIVEIYGISEGLTSYTSVFGSIITLPKIHAEYMVVK